MCVDIPLLASRLHFLLLFSLHCSVLSPLEIFSFCASVARPSWPNTTPRLPSAGPEALNICPPPAFPLPVLFYSAAFDRRLLLSPASGCRFWLPFCTTFQRVPDCLFFFTTHGGHLCPIHASTLLHRGWEVGFFTAFLFHSSGLMSIYPAHPLLHPWFKKLLFHYASCSDKNQVGVIFCCSLFVSIRVHPPARTSSIRGSRSWVFNCSPVFPLYLQEMNTLWP